MLLAWPEGSCSFPMDPLSCPGPALLPGSIVNRGAGGGFCREDAGSQLCPSSLGWLRGQGQLLWGGGTVRSPLAIRHTWMAAVDVRLDQSRDAPAVQGWG